MRPTQALRKDWPMYYNDTYMLHKDLGVVRVQVNRTGGFVCTQPGVERWVPAKGSDLDVWWPRAGAYNTPTNAVYISRKAHRCMKKSAALNSHYFIKWGPPEKMSIALANGPNYLTWPTAKEVMEKGAKRSCAITREIIISKTMDPHVYELIYRGDEAGTLSRGIYEPKQGRAPSTKLVLHALLKEGIIE